MPQDRWWKVMGMWDKVDDQGSVYLETKLGAPPETVRFLVIQNPHKKEARHPDYLLLADRNPKEFLPPALSFLSKVFHRRRRRHPLPEDE